MYTHVCLCRCVFTYLCITYIYIYIHRERDVVMCIYIHMYIHICCVYIYIYIYIHIYIHTCIHTYLHTYLPTYLHTYVRTYLHMHIYIYIHTYAYIHTYIHTYMHACMHTYIHTCIHTYIHTYPFAPQFPLEKHFASGRHTARRGREGPFVPPDALRSISRLQDPAPVQTKTRTLNPAIKIAVISYIMAMPPGYQLFHTGNKAANPTYHSQNNPGVQDPAPVAVFPNAADRALNLSRLLMLLAAP